MDSWETLLDWLACVFKAGTRDPLEVVRAVAGTLHPKSSVVSSCASGRDTGTCGGDTPSFGAFAFSTNYTN